MVLLEIMLKRKSVCKFTKDEISKEQFMKLEELMNYLIAGILALGIPEGNVEPQSLDNIGKSKIHFLIWFYYFSP